MKRLKQIGLLLFLLAMCLVLTACSDDSISSEPTLQTTVPTEPIYCVYVVDEAGEPIAGVPVQIGKNLGCLAATDEEGKASFQLERADYKVTLMMLPAGFTYPTEQEVFTFAPGQFVLTIVLRAKP